MTVSVSIPLDFAFKADGVLLLMIQIFASFENATNTNHCPVTLRAIKGALSLFYQLALLKSTLQDTSLGLGTLKFVPLSGDEPVIFDVVFCGVSSP